MAYNASADLWYLHFKGESTQSNILLAVYAIRSLWATVGILSNLAIVYVTIFSKTLHGVCNILIALESFFAIFQDASYYVSFIVYTSGIKFITYQACFPILIPLSMCGDNAQMSMVFTGADRLLSVLFPIWYKSRNKKYYLTFVGISLVAYAIYQFIINYIDFLQSDAVLMSCSTHEMGQGGLGTLMYIDGITLSAILMTLYVILWITVFLLHPIAKTVNENNRKLIKSLILIISMNLIGVFVKCSISYLFSTYLRVDVFVKTEVAIGFSFLTIAVYSANAPVLYVFSKEYRNKFNAHFKFLERVFEKANTTVNQQQPPTTNAFTTTVHNYASTVRASTLFMRRTHFGC